MRSSPEIVGFQVSGYCKYKLVPIVALTPQNYWLLIRDVDHFACFKIHCVFFIYSSNGDNWNALMCA